MVSGAIFEHGQKVSEIADVLKALADASRLEIVQQVLNSDGQEACVCDLTDAAGLTQGTVSHHLKVLVEAGLLAREQRGKWAYFTLTPSASALAISLGLTKSTLIQSKSQC
jgi:ArsR family transcriptional regulator